jgi:Tfp pilus assembly protein PilO
MTLQGDYDDIRRFIHHVESGTDFIVIDSISLRQGTEADSPLTLALSLSTYYRVVPDGP